MNESEQVSIGIAAALVWLVASLAVARVLYWRNYRGKLWEIDDSVPTLIVSFLAWPFIVMWLIVVWERENK
jgi:hypothetical protein